MVHPRRFVRESLGVALSQYVARAMLLVRGIVAAAALGPHGYGAWNALSLIFDYGSYATVGAQHGLDLKLPGVVAKGDGSLARRLMAGAWTMTALGGLVFSLAFMGYLVAGGRAFAALPSVAMPLLMLLAALGQLAVQYLASSLRAHGRIHAVSSGLATQAVIGAGTGLALVFPYGIWGLLLGWLAGTSTALLLMRRAIPEAPVATADLATGRSLVGAGFPLFAYFAATLVLRSVDRMALVRFGAPESLGLYAVGLMAAGTILYLPESVAFVLFPRMAAAHRGARDPKATRVEVIQAHRALAVLLPLLTALGMVLAEPILARLLPDFRPGIPALLALAAAAMLLGAATVPGYYLLASGRERRVLAVGIAAAIFNGVLAFSVAARDPQPQSVAQAMFVGQGLFGLAIVSLAVWTWLQRAGERWLLIVQSFAPALLAGAIVMLALRVFPGIDGLSTLGRTFIVTAAYAPVAGLFGRGVGLSTLVREWVAARRG